jgi:hypothetical protein
VFSDAVLPPVAVSLIIWAIGFPGEQFQSALTAEHESLGSDLKASSSTQAVTQIGEEGWRHLRQASPMPASLGLAVSETKDTIIRLTSRGVDSFSLSLSEGRMLLRGMIPSFSRRAGL